MSSPSHPLAILALTSNGVRLGERLREALEGGEVRLIRDNAREEMTALFQAGRALVCVMALGIVVRILGPVLGSKRDDPAVVVVDEAGRFAVSVLGGHAAGANELTRRVAEALEAVPVITTASEALGLPALDGIGKEWGWKIDPLSQTTQVLAAAVRGEPIAVYQETGRRDWWEQAGVWPEHIHLASGGGNTPGKPPKLEILPPPLSFPEGWAGLVWITDRQIVTSFYPTLILRPPSLVLGVGCRRGVPGQEIEDFFQYLCRTHGFAPLSLGMVATADLKADEPGLREFARRHDVSLRTFSLEELARVADLPTPSERVRAKIGVAGVAEPAALLAAGASQLLLTKQRGPRITMALARRDNA
ncbi:MAG: cobalt-precorrin 5A hydrolase [Gemmataceae bacterium]